MLNILNKIFNSLKMYRTLLKQSSSLALGLLFQDSSKFPYQIVSTDVSSGASMSYLPATAMKTYPTPDTGFASHQPESKVRQMFGFFGLDTWFFVRACPEHINQILR